MCAYRRDCIKAISCAHDIDLLVWHIGNRIEWIKIWSTGAKIHGRLEQGIWQEVAIGHNQGAESGNTKRARRNRVQEITASDFAALRFLWHDAHSCRQDVS